MWFKYKNKPPKNKVGFCFCSDSFSAAYNNRCKYLHFQESKGLHKGAHRGKVTAFHKIELFKIRGHNRANFCKMINTMVTTLCFDQNYISRQRVADQDSFTKTNHVVKVTSKTIKNLSRYLYVVAVTTMGPVVNVASQTLKK